MNVIIIKDDKLDYNHDGSFNPTKKQSRIIIQIY